eukprot:gene14575-17229_t
MSVMVGVLAYQQQGDQVFLNCGFCKYNTLALDDKARADLQITSRAAKDVSQQQLAFNKVLEQLTKESAEAPASKDTRTLTRIKLAQAMKQFFNPSSLSSGAGGNGSNGGAAAGAKDERWSNTRSVASPQPPNTLMPPGTQLLSKSAIKKRVNPVTVGDVDDMQATRSQARVFSEVDPTTVDDDHVSEELLTLENAEGICSLSQRLLQSSPKHMINSLIPVHRHLLTRRSKRCRRCDKLLVKPDINPAKTEFKRQHFAFSYVPRVSVVRAVWEASDLFTVSLLLTNPLHSTLFLAIAAEDNRPISAMSTADNSRVLDHVTETYIGGLLDETDDKESGVLQQLKANENAAYVVDRKDNKLTLKFVLKAGIPTIQESQEESEVSIDESLANQLKSLSIPSTPTSKPDLKKYPASYPNLKFAH